MTLYEATPQKEYLIRAVQTEDAETDAFLFSLGCYSGEPITVVSRLSSGVIVTLKDSRYSFDRRLAEAILV